MLATCGKPSRGRYVQGCRCEACTLANNAYWHKREKDKAKEHFGAKDPYWTDAEPVRAHLRKLLAEGYTKRGICRDYGIPRPTIHNLMTAHHRTGKPVKRIKTETARRILEIGSHVSFVYYRDDQPVKVFDSLEDFCNETGRTMKNARWLCTPSAQKKRTYLVRVNY